MNKYQEALDYLNQPLHWKNDAHEIGKNIDTLQELIDNYSKLEQFDRAIYFNASGLVVDGISYEQLEKALDKACKVIAHTDTCWDMSENGCDYECAKCWKEHLLKED